MCCTRLFFRLPSQPVPSLLATINSPLSPRLASTVRSMMVGQVPGADGRLPIRPRFQRPTQPPTGGGLSWWLLPLRGGHGRGLRRFAAVMAEVFAPSWWSRRGSFIHRHKNNAKNRFTCDFRLFYHMNLLGVCASSRHLRRQANFRRNRREGGKTEKATSTGRWRWSYGGLRRAALEVTAVFCGHGRCFILEVFFGFSIWRLKRHNPQFAFIAGSIVTQNKNPKQI